MHDLALPAARARRKRLPRPPKFTRGDKLWMLYEALVGTLCVVWFLHGTAPIGALCGMTAAASGIRSTILSALGRHLEGWRGSTLAMSLWLAATVAFLIGV